MRVCGAHLQNCTHRRRIEQRQASGLGLVARGNTVDLQEPVKGAEKTSFQVFGSPSDQQIRQPPREPRPSSTQL